MQTDNPELSALATMVRRHDRDRYAAAMFSPPDRRDDLFALYAVNIELSQIRSLVREPMAGLIRLQWWREAVDGSRDDEAAGHPAAGALRGVMRKYDLPVEEIIDLIDAREADLNRIPFQNIDDFRNYARRTGGTLMHLAVLILGGDSGGAVEIGTACAMAGLLSSVRYHAAQDWMVLPVHMIEPLGVDFFTAAHSDCASLAPAVAELRHEAEKILTDAVKRRHDVKARPALLPAVAARRRLHKIKLSGDDVGNARIIRPEPMPLRLLWAHLSGRL